MLMKDSTIGSVLGEVLISEADQTARADDPVCAQSP